MWLPVPVVDVLLADVFAVGREVVAGRRMDVAATHQEQHVAGAGPRGRRDDVSAAAGHVARRAVPLLPAVRLQVLQVERVPVVQQQRLARPRRHVHRLHCVKTLHVTRHSVVGVGDTANQMCSDLAI